jgi:hypothetical protein
MSETQTLDEAILDTELRYINFFNGRLLSAEDLSQEQTVNRARARHLGLAIGAGIAYGLEVSVARGTVASQGLVEVAAGLAVNAEGQTLRLECAQTVALVQTPDPSETSECLFADCAPLAAGATASSAGYYVLTIAPASKSEGLAPVSGLSNRLANCNSKYYAEGVKFRFLQLRTSASGVTARGVIAYECFGHPNSNDALTAALASGAETDYGLKTLLASGDLTTADVPLAIVEWKASGELGFIDLWSVRRRVTRPAAEAPWSFFMSDRRRSETEAMFLQFQEQIRSIQSETSGTPVRAVDRFAYLPPAGVLPVHARLTDWRIFFNVSYSFSYIQPSHVRETLEEAFGFEPIATNQLSSSTITIHSVTGRTDVLFTRNSSSYLP